MDFRHCTTSCAGQWALKKRETNKVRWVPQITTWTKFPDPHKGSGETQTTWWSHWVKGTVFRVWSAKVARNYGPVYWEEGTTSKGSSRSVQRGPLNPWQMKARQKHCKEVVNNFWSSHRARSSLYSQHPKWKYRGVWHTERQVEPTKG